MSRLSSLWIARLITLSLAAAVAVLALQASAVSLTPDTGSSAAGVHRRLLTQGAERVFEPRFAGAPVHRPFRAAQKRPAQVLVRWQVAARLEALRPMLPAGSSHAAAAEGLSRLYRDDTAGALALLRDAVHRDPAEPSYWCDLAAAALVRGEPTDLLEALESADVALELKPSLEAAAFNRALALERLGLLRAAHDAWTDAARLATATGWAAEARERARALGAAEGPPVTADAILRTAPHDRRALAHTNLDRVRKSLEDELIPRLGVVCSEGPRPECAALLADVRATAIAAGEAAPGDRWWPAVAAQLEEWGRSDWRASSRGTVLRQYTAGVQLFAADRVAQSAEVFRLLVAYRGDPILTVHWNASYHACLDAYFRGDHDRARTCLAAFDEAAAGHGFSYLRGKAEWVRAQISLAEGNLARAAGEFERAIARMRESGDVNQLAAIRSLRATLLDQLGSFDDAWRDRTGALIHARLEPRRRHTLLTSAARSALLQRFPRTALEFAAAAVANAGSWGQAGALVEAHLASAEILHRLGRQREAQQHLERARLQFAGIADERARSRFDGEVAVTEGEVLAAAAPAEALAALAAAAPRLASLQLDLLRVRAERAAGLALERLRRPVEALAAFERGIAMVERQRRHLGASRQVQSLDVTWDLYDRLIARRLADTGPDTAFAAAESARSQERRGFLPTDAPAAPALSAVPGLLPERTTIVYFVVLEAQTLRWTIRREGIDLVRLPLGRQARPRSRSAAASRAGA